MNLKLNSLNRDLFMVSGANDIRVNTAGGKHISRNDGEDGASDGFDKMIQSIMAD